MSWEITDILTRRAALAYGSQLADDVDRPTLPTGMETWDRLCDETGGRGLGDWWYVVIGGASNAGKTQLGFHLLRRAAEHLLYPGLVTMEIPRKGVQRQFYSRITSFGYYDFLPDRWVDGDYVGKLEGLGNQVHAYRGEVQERTLQVAEFTGPPTLADILAACEQLLEKGCRVLMVDHLQLIKASPEQIADRATEVSEALRWFAHGNKMLMIALSQLNRLASRERAVCPTMHDLLGGTSIESNANQVMLIDHSKQARDLQHPHLVRTWLALDKNREGPSRVRIPVEANFKTGRWREAQPDEIQLWPGTQQEGD